MTTQIINLGTVITADQLTPANHGRLIKAWWQHQPMRTPITGTLTEARQVGDRIVLRIDDQVMLPVPLDAQVIVQ